MTELTNNCDIATSRGEWKSWLKLQHSGNEDHGIRSHHFMADNGETVTDFIFSGSKITVNGDCSHEIKRHLLLGRKAYDNHSQYIKKQKHHFADKSLYSQSSGFSSSYAQMWKLDHKEGWALKNWLIGKAPEARKDWGQEKKGVTEDEMVG